MPGALRSVLVQAACCPSEFPSRWERGLKAEAYILKYHLLGRDVDKAKAALTTSFKRAVNPALSRFLQTPVVVVALATDHADIRTVGFGGACTDIINWSNTFCRRCLNDDLARTFISAIYFAECRRRVAAH